MSSSIMYVGSIGSILNTILCKHITNYGSTFTSTINFLEIDITNSSSLMSNIDAFVLKIG